ncbi:unnamed protein product [Orchesella dallaii]|uniref:Uncharacterized protein n=1 Tax=Orchesella dallaii TaxID=48710 RepID=A0ABP1Q260_9HEXA
MEPTLVTSESIDDLHARTSLSGRSIYGESDGEDTDKNESDEEDTGEIETERNAQRVIELLGLSNNVKLSEKHTHALKDAQGQTFDKLFSSWSANHDHSDDEEERVKDFDQNHRLELLWSERKPFVNYMLSISFHVVVIANFFYCMWESFGILVEDAKFDYLYLHDVYQCLKIIPSHDSASHIVSIFHAVTCVAVLHAKTLQTANLCWAFLLGTAVHACFKVYEVIFNERFDTGDPSEHSINLLRITQLLFALTMQLVAVLVILQRYYDLTARFKKRAHKFVTQTYEGRQLNDRIIYRNATSFVQRKYVLRSCTAFQIYSTVQRIQIYRKKHHHIKTPGEEEYINNDIIAAVTALREVEGCRGMKMMRELKRRNYERLREETALAEVAGADGDALPTEEEIEELGGEGGLDLDEPVIRA